MENNIREFMRLLTVLFFCLAISSCASINIQELSNDTYIIEKQDLRGVFGSKASFVESVKGTAREMARAQGGIVSEISLNYLPPAPAQFASINYKFRVVQPRTKQDIERINNISNRCIVENVVDYDDGVTDVEPLARAVVNRCEKQCIYDQIDVNNLTVKHNKQFQDSCVDHALDTIFNVRKIKRKGGDIERYNDILFIKRKADGHFITTASIFDQTYSVELSLNCQIGIRQNSLNSIDFKLQGSHIKNSLNITDDNNDIIKLSVNNKIIAWSKFKQGESFILSKPAPDWDSFFSNESNLKIKHNGKEIVFNTGYREAIKAVKSECITQ